MEKISHISVALLGAWGLLLVAAAQSPVDSSKFTIPGLSSSTTNDSCANVDCQKGTCVPNNSSAIEDVLFPYKCQCDPGWSTLESVFSLLAIPSLPCNVPNCSLNLNCSGSSPTAAPAPAAATSANTSACLVDGICGHGKCEVVSNSSLFSSFKCVCDPGYANVLNLTGGYCASQCEIGGSCSSLGITLPGLSPPPPPPGSPGSANQTASSPNAGMTSPGVPNNGLGTPVSSPRSPEAVPGGQSPSSSPGCRQSLFSSGIVISAALVMGSFFASTF